ncbi:hypothetical protein BDP27DRAFT_1148414, partial [Rhodocollybia butyracea]
LGHANYQAIYDMSQKDMVKGMPIDLSSAPPKCQSCVLGKQTKTPVPKKREEGHRATRRLEKVWVDLSGPEARNSACHRSRTGNNYIMNIVDDYTSYPWTIPLVNKDD